MQISRNVCKIPNVKDETWQLRVNDWICIQFINGLYVVKIKRKEENIMDIIQSIN